MFFCIWYFFRSPKISIFFSRNSIVFECNTTDTVSEKTEETVMSVSAESQTSPQRSEDTTDSTEGEEIITFQCIHFPLDKYLTDDSSAAFATPMTL